MRLHLFLLTGAALICLGTPALSGADWTPLAVPGTWEEQSQPAYDGVAWYRCWVKGPADWAGKDVTLAVENVDTAHEAYVNGAKVGGAGRFPPGYQNGLDAANRYVVPREKFRAGDWNVIAIRVYDHDGRGGFKGNAPQLGTDKQHISLAGRWQFRTGDDLEWASSPLTPALTTSVGEATKPSATDPPQRDAPLLPLPRRGGEGRGEGASPTQTLPTTTNAPATFTTVEDGPVPLGARGHTMSSRGHPLTPAEAAKSFTVPEDLEIEQVLAEPLVRQPVFLNFDERGRMWVVQYIQYPAPAGLTVVSKDQFWRAVYDKVPEPPPRGVRGLDKITIHEDTDGDGVFDTHKTFVDGLNIATACVKGRGGVWVLNPPYFLFYPDKNNDDVPDGDPVVHLEGFGLEDTHSVVNSLRWGPDGWLYAAQGSTVTANVRVRAQNDSGRATLPRSPDQKESSARQEPRPTTTDYLRRSTRPGEPPVYSQGQNIWRYHPEKQIYEIFAEGGGNAFGVEFDDKGRLFSGHNGGDTRGFHYMQGAYLRKGFEKHGELSNPYAFGYFPHMEGTKGERFTHTFIIYHGGALPPRYEGKLFGVEPLQGRVVLSEMTPDGSTFRTRDLERIVTSSDSWFRPVDIKSGPDGAIYIADWYDRQVTHTRNQEGNIDTSNGRIYRLKKKGAKAEPILGGANLSKRSGRALIGTLGLRNDWYRQTTLRVLADHRDRSSIPDLRELLYGNPEQEERRWDLEGIAFDFGPANELYSFWGVAVSGGFNADLATKMLQHPNAQVRLWTARLIGDGSDFPEGVQERLQQRAITETNLEVRAQLACTAKRLPAADALPIVRNLLAHDEDARDPRLPLLCWWAIESKCESDRDAVLKLFEDSTLWTRPIVEQHLLGRLMRRFAAAGTRQDLLTCAKLLQLSPTREHSLKLMAGFDEAFKGRSLAGLPDELITAMARHRVGSDVFRLRRGEPAAIERALALIANSQARSQTRLQIIQILGEAKQPAALAPLLALLKAESDSELRKATLTSLLGYDSAAIGTTVVELYNSLTGDVRAAAQTLLSSRAAWSLNLARAVEAGRTQPADVPLDIVRQMKRHKSDELATLLNRHWPRLGHPTTAEMQKQIQRFGAVLRDGRGDPYGGQKLFNTACASCHTLFARGGRVGPDLTAYQRGDLDTMLLHIVDPSAEIREGYEGLVIETKDDRSLTGFLVERDAAVVVIRGADGQNITLEQKDIAEMKAAGLSLMPEGLLDNLTDQQLRDLFAYLRSTQPLAN